MRSWPKRDAIAAVFLGCLAAAGCKYDLDKLRGPTVAVDAPVMEPDTAETFPDAPVSEVAPDIGAEVIRDAIPGPPEVFPDRANPVALPANVVAKDALVGYWPLDEAPGSPYTYDATEGGNDGVVIGGTARFRTFGFARAAFPNTGCFGAELNDFIEIASKTLPDIDAPKTVSLWVRFDYELVANATMALSVMIFRDRSAGIRIELRNKRLVVTNYGFIEILGMDPPSLGLWHHVVYTFDGNVHSLRLDNGTPVTVATGALSAEQSIGSGPLKHADARFRLGKSSSSVQVTDGLRGFLDDVRVYNRALTDAEIEALWAGAR